MAILRALVVAAFCCALANGCGGAVSDELTTEQIEKQRAEDKLSSAAEDKAEAEFQRKVRQQGS